MSQTDRSSRIDAPLSLADALDKADMAVVVLDRDGKILRFTQRATKIYQITPSDVGRRLSEIPHHALHLAPLPDFADSVALPDDRPTEIRLAKNHWFSRRIFPVSEDSTVSTYWVTFTDITALKRADLGLAAEHEVTELLATASSFSDVDHQIATVIRKTLQAEIALIWTYDEHHTLRCVANSIEDNDRSAQSFVEHSRKFVFAKDEGLPGQAAAALDACWVEDVRDQDWFVRAATASECGMISGIAMPIVSGNQCLGVLEFFCKRPLDRDRWLVDMLRSIGHQIGLFIRRFQAEQSLRNEEARKSAILANALDGIVTMNVDGQIIDFNRAAEEIFGWTAEAAKGRSLAETIIPEEMRSSHRAGLSRYVKEGIPTILGKRIEIEAVRSNGQRFPIDLSVTAARELDGSPFFIGFVRDISERKRQELEIRRSEAFLRRTLDSLFAFVGVCTPDGTLIQANRPALEAAGMGPDDVIGRPFWETYWWSHDVTVQQQLRQAIEKAAEGQASRYDVDIRVGGGEIITIDFQLVPMRDEDNVVTHLIPSGTDISQRKKLERSLIESREQLLEVLHESESDKAKLRVIFDQSWYYVGALDLQGNVLDVNRTGLEVCGYTREEVFNRPFWETGWWSGSKEVQEKIKKACEQAIQGVSFREELPYWFADGTQRMVDFAMTPARNENDEIIFIMPSGADITDRKLAESREKREADVDHFLSEAGVTLASSLDYEHTLERVVQLCVPTFADWAFVDLIDTDGDVRRVTVAHRDPQHAALARRVAQFQPDPRWQDHPPARGLFGAKGLVIPDFTEEILVKAAQNSAHEAVMREVGPKSLVVVPLVARGTVFGALTLIYSDSGRRYDSFDLRVAEELAGRSAMAIDNARLFHEGQLANLAKSEFIANMSHEIRTPMTAVLGYADLLLASEEDAEKRKFLETIQRNGKFLLDIINDILDLSKIESGKMDLVSEDCNVVEVVSDVHSMMQGRAAAKQIGFELHYDGKLPQCIQSDPKRLRQILVNLVGNAIKFTEAGCVKLTVREMSVDGSSKIQFLVSDTGIGIDDEQRLRLFVPFDQGDASVTRKYGGTGLGLAISQRLAGLLGGHIAVESTAGRGSVFSFVIDPGDIGDVPRIDPMSAPSGGTAEPPRTETIRLSCRVLVVDDRRDVRFLAGHILRNQGAKVDFCEDGLVACEFVQGVLERSDTLDLILLDMQMPRMDGYQAASRLRELGYHGPIIALTADAMHGDMSRCIESGCDDYLSKPIDTHELLHTVSRFTSADPQAK